MNAYVIILGLFVLGGIATSLWGLRLLAHGRRTRAWPQTKGRIDRAEVVEEHDDLLPRIEFSYTVGGRPYSRAQEFPAGITPTPEFARFYIDKYPPGSQVQVYYHPTQPEIATLEPGLASGDWLVLALGLAATVIGLVLLLS